MRQTEKQGVERAIDLCLAARAQVEDLIQDHGSEDRGASRLRLLFDILLLELGREFARQIQRDED